MTTSTVYSNILNQFSVCRQPWNSYISHITRQDTAPYSARLFDKPAYRGRKVGKEGWLFSQKSQLHFHMYPDEKIFANLSRWRHGDTVGDLSIQQFKGVQPFNIDRDDPLGHKSVSPETYLKLNYKNPATISRFLTRTGSFYPQDILTISPEAFMKLRKAKSDARVLGLYPRFGNPFWHRSQKFRPKPNADLYDPLSTKTKDVMSHFAFNWLQTDRVKQYFTEINEAASKSSIQGRNTIRTSGNANTNTNLTYPSGTGTGRRRGAWGNIGSDSIRPSSFTYDQDGVQYSSKNPTVPGLMSTSGMKKRMFNLYSGSSKKRMGFTNPVFGIRKT